MSVRSRLLSIIDKSMAAYGLVLRTGKRSSLFNDPSLNAGAGVPSGTEPKASAWFRNDGANGNERWYVSDGAGTWTAVPIDDMVSAVVDVATLQTDLDAAEADIVTLQADVAATVLVADAAQPGSAVLTALAAAGLDYLVIAVIAVADSLQDSALTLQLKRIDGTTNIASARQVMLVAGSQYMGGAPNASLTLGSVTKGSVVATIQAGGQWLIETDATGAFACTATNTDDEAVYYYVQGAITGSTSGSKMCAIVGTNSDLATTTS